MHTLINPTDVVVNVPVVDANNVQDYVPVQPKSRATVVASSTVDPLWLSDHPSIGFYPDPATVE